MASSRQSTGPTATMFDLPIDLTFEILSRLPVRSLLRFKCVCKNWYALIQSPSFVYKHLMNKSSTLNPNSNFNSLLVTHIDRGNNRSYKIGMSLHYFNKYGFDGHINLDFPFLKRRKTLSVVGVCDGLVCLSLARFGCALILCNPATRQFREIPDFKLDKDEYGEGVYKRRVSFGFGFDPNANDYKLIRLVSYRRATEKFVEAHLYVISTGTWREIDGIKHFFSGEGVTDDVLGIGGCRASVVMDGVFYWPAAKDTSKEVFFVSFGMGDEEFRKITTPPMFDQFWDETYWWIMQLKDKLAVVITDIFGGFDLWVLNVKERSWANQVKMGHFPKIASPVGCDDENSGEITVVGMGKNGELVVTYHEQSGDIKLFSYDTKSQEIKSLRFGQVPYRSSICLYTETLLPVKEKQ